MSIKSYRSSGIVNAREINENEIELITAGYALVMPKEAFDDLFREISDAELNLIGAAITDGLVQEEL